MVVCTLILCFSYARTIEISHCIEHLESVRTFRMMGLAGVTDPALGIAC
jgi:hypothetical protein